MDILVFWWVIDTVLVIIITTNQQQGTNISYQCVVKFLVLKCSFEEERKK